MLGWKTLTRWDHFHILAGMVLVAEAAICAAAIRYIPCELTLRAKTCIYRNLECKHTRHHVHLQSVEYS